MKNQVNYLGKTLLSGVLFLFVAANVNAQSSKDKARMADCQVAKEEVLKADPSLSSYFKSAYAYVIFPSVGKGGFVVGGAHGNGIVYKNGNAIGTAEITQVTVGAQVGGQSFIEILFLEDERALENFKSKDFKLAAQASAIAITQGEQADVRYNDGVAIITKTNGGLMIEASVGGQGFSFKPFK